MNSSQHNFTNKKMSLFYVKLHVTFGYEITCVFYAGFYFCAGRIYLTPHSFAVLWATYFIIIIIVIYYYFHRNNLYSDIALDPSMRTYTQHIYTTHINSNISHYLFLIVVCRVSCRCVPRHIQWRTWL